MFREGITRLEIWGHSVGGLGLVVFWAPLSSMSERYQVTKIPVKAPRTWTTRMAVRAPEFSLKLPEKMKVPIVTAELKWAQLISQLTRDTMKRTRAMI